jgi:citrate synthase
MTATQQVKGLEGVVVATSTLSLVEGTEGRLSYRGYDIHDLAEQATFEEVTYLLWYGELPTPAQLVEFGQRLAPKRGLPDAALRILRDLPADGAPIDALRTLVSALGMFDRDVDDITPAGVLQKAEVLLARLPTILAAYDRLRHNQEPIPPRADLGHAANLLYMLNGEEPPAESVAALNSYLVMLAEHSLNASTFTARVAISTLSDYYCAITAAIGALKGISHGGANQKAMEMLMEIGSPDNVPAFVDNALATKRRLMGMGHRIYKTRDPRAIQLARHSQRLVEITGDARWHDTAARLDALSREHAYFNERKLYPNVEFYSAPVLYMLGFAPDLMPALFACSRITGWTGHILEQIADNRIIRPSAEYIGPAPPRPFVPLAER